MVTLPSHKPPEYQAFLLLDQEVSQRAPKAHNGFESLHECLQAGADADAKEQGGARPIDAAASAQQRDVVELLLPCTTPSKGAKWTAGAVMEAAAEQQQQQHQHHQHDGCCGCSHEHEHEHEEQQVP